MSMNYQGRMWLPATPIIDKDDDDINRSHLSIKSIDDSKNNNNIDHNIGNERDDMQYYYEYPLLHQYYQPQIVKSGKVFALHYYFIPITLSIVLILILILIQLSL